jgi:hypothetical protein
VRGQATVTAGLDRREGKSYSLTALLSLILRTSIPPTDHQPTFSDGALGVKELDGGSFVPVESLKVTERYTPNPLAHCFLSRGVNDTQREVFAMLTPGRIFANSVRLSLRLNRRYWLSGLGRGRYARSLLSNQRISAPVGQPLTKPFGSSGQWTNKVDPISWTVLERC